MGTSKRVEILGELPSPAKYLKIFRARHPRLKTDLEFRLAAGDDDRDPRTTFFLDELAVLTKVDHPCFPPVLDRGTYEGKPFYALPFRRNQPSLASLLEDEALTTAHRCEAARGLASGLAALHRRDLVLGALHPGLVAWRADHLLPSLPFPLGARALKPARGFPTLPGSLDLEALDPRTRDVVRWGLLAHWLIGRGEEPFLEDGSVMPFAAGEVPYELGLLIEGALGVDPAARPADAEDLHAVLAVLARDQEDRIASKDPTRQGLTVEQGLEELRKSRAGVRLVSDEDPGWMDPVRDRWRELGARVQWGVAALWAALCCLHVVAVLTPVLERWRSSRRVAAVQAPVDASADHPLNDPAVKALVAARQVGPGDLDDLLRKTRQASRKRLLPRRLDDPVRLQRILNQKTRDPEAAAAALAKWLDELRAALGVGAPAG